MKQRDIVSLLRHEFGHHEVTVFSASAKNRAGVLDCEIAYRGQSFWVEIKIDKDKLSPLQKKFMTKHYLRSIALIYNDVCNKYVTVNPSGQFFEVELADLKIKQLFDYAIRLSIQWSSLNNNL